MSMVLVAIGEHASALTSHGRARRARVFGRGPAWDGGAPDRRRAQAIPGAARERTGRGPSLRYGLSDDIPAPSWVAPASIACLCAFFAFAFFGAGFASVVPPALSSPADMDASFGAAPWA